MDLRQVPRGRGGDGRLPRPMGAGALQIDHHYICRRDAEVIKNPDITIGIFAHQAGRS